MKTDELLDVVTFLSLCLENNNKVFKHCVFDPQTNGNVFYREDYYLVKNKQVYLIQENMRNTPEFLYPTNDSVFETTTKGIPCGKFNEKKKYPMFCGEFELKDLKKSKIIKKSEII